MDEIKDTCETIIFNEFSMVINSDGYLVIERNSKKPLHEYAIEILESKGHVMKIEDISKAINEKHPELETTEQTVRANIQKEKNDFIFIGRTSTYGLRRWEKENESLKGGTIRDIVKEFLDAFNTPKHISEILIYVQKYRNTNERSVMTNIEVEENNRFQFFEGNYVGLKGKTYSLDTLNYKRLNGSHFNSKMLAKMNGKDLESAIDYYVKKYGYSNVQVKHLFQKKITEGLIKITPNNKIKV